MKVTLQVQIKEKGTGIRGSYSVLLNTSGIVTFDDVDESKDVILGDVIQQHLVHLSILSEARTINDVNSMLEKWQRL